MTSLSEQRAAILRGIDAGRPELGPMSVHVDVTNRCNAACITCWDHSPLLKVARPPSWKSRRMPRDRFEQLMDELTALGSVRDVVVSGMGEPLTHPDIYAMLGRVKSEGWHLTVLTNLLAADIDALIDAEVDNLLVGVHGATPATYAAFHPGWDERDFARMCKGLRQLNRAGVRTRHVHVINRDTASEVVDMVRFGKSFGAQRVNYKLASLAGGTEDCAVTAEQVVWLRDEGIPRARALASDLGVGTNLHLFEQQISAAASGVTQTTDMGEVGCFMGHVYTRITVDLEVLYCCNTNISVGSLRDSSFSDLWWGEKWQGLREHIAAGRFFAGCERCGKFEQNVKWAERVRVHTAPSGAA